MFKVFLSLGVLYFLGLKVLQVAKMIALHILHVECGFRVRFVKKCCDSSFVIGHDLKYQYSLLSGSENGVQILNALKRQRRRLNTERNKKQNSPRLA